jgi:DNA processing protein
MPSHGAKTCCHRGRPCGYARWMRSRAGHRSRVWTRRGAVVSGGAFGIDAAAHEGALASGAPTFAVLGCGTDVTYPDRHAALFARIAASGGLLSEYPPGTPAASGPVSSPQPHHRGTCRGRDRGRGSHAFGRAHHGSPGREFGRTLFAVPGSPGTDAYLRAGLALPATSATDIERVLAGGQACAHDGPPAPGPLFAILDAIALGTDTPAGLCQRLGVSLPSILAILAEAELEGFVRRAAGNTYEVIGRAC